jgi:hypothetical protein
MYTKLITEKIYLAPSIKITLLYKILLKMEENKYHKKLEKKLLIAIYNKYVAEQGDQPSQLDVWRFSSTEPDIFKLTPEILIDTPDKRIANSDARYLGNLKEYGFILNNPKSSFFIHLTNKGFYEAKRLISPYKCFFKEHWKFFTALFFTVITTSAAIVRLIECT